MVKVPISCSDPTADEDDIDFINETEVSHHQQQHQQHNSRERNKSNFFVESAKGVVVRRTTKSSPANAERVSKQRPETETCSITMASDESVVVSSGESTSLNLVDSSGQEIVPEEASGPSEEDVPETTSTESYGLGVVVADPVQLAVPVLLNKAPAAPPPMLPNTVIAVVQPTTRTHSNYVRINANPAASSKAREQSSHYVAVPQPAPAAQRIVVNGAPLSSKSQHQQQSRRVVSQVPYALPGITIHHCQPGPGATVVANAPPTQQVWPIVDPVFNFGSGFEPPSRPYCPTHEPQPQEHVVMFHVHPGVSVSFQIGGNQEIVRGKWG